MKIDYIPNSDDISFLETAWSEIVTNNNDDRFYLTFEWYGSLLKLCGIPPNELHLFVVKNGEEIVGIVPCELTKKKKRIFLLNTLQLAGNIYSFERGAIVRKELIGNAAEAFAAYLCNEFSKSWDIIEFANVSPHDEFHASFRRALDDFGAISYQQDKFTNVVTDLSGFADFEEFNDSISKNVKRKITKSINKMNRSGAFSIQLCDGDSDALARLVDDYYKVYSKSWKKGERDPEFHRNMAGYLHEKGKLRLLVLYFKPAEEEAESQIEDGIKSAKDGIGGSGKIVEGGLPIAAYYAIQEGKSTFGLKTVYDTEHRNYSAGSVLVYFFIKYLINKEKSLILNHQIGTEEFKYQMGGKNNAEYFNYYAANKGSFLAKTELLVDIYVVPIYKKIRCRFQRNTE